MVATITAGKGAVVYVSGAPATLTTEATTKSGSNKIFQITDPTKQVLDPTYAITQNWSSGPAGTVTINRLTGTFTSSVDEGSKTLTISGKYLPMAAFIYARDFSMKIDPRIMDITPLGQSYQTVYRGSSGVSGTLSSFYDPAEVTEFTPDITKYFTTEMIADATVAIKLYVHANLSILAWATINSEELKAAVDGLQEDVVGWEGTRDANGNVLSRV